MAPVSEGTSPPTGLGAVGEYQVDGGLWAPVMGTIVSLPDGPHALSVRLYGWCRYEAAVRGTDGAFDVAAIPLYYKEPKNVPVPDWAWGHRVLVDIAVDAVTFIEPEILSRAPRIGLGDN